MLDGLGALGQRAAEARPLRRRLADARTVEVGEQRAGANTGQRLIEVAVDEELARGLALALHAAECGAGVERRAHRALVIGFDFAEVDLGGEAAVLVDRVHVVQHRLGVLVDVGQQRHADDLLQLGEIDVRLVGLERALGDDRQELVELGAHEVAVARLVVLDSADGRAGVEHAQHLPLVVRVEGFRAHLRHEARRVGDRAHGVERGAGVVERVG